MVCEFASLNSFLKMAALTAASNASGNTPLLKGSLNKDEKETENKSETFSG